MISIRSRRIDKEHKIAKFEEGKSLTISKCVSGMSMGDGGHAPLTETKSHFFGK